MTKSPVCQPGRLYDLLEAPPMIINNLNRTGLQHLFLEKHLTYKPQYDAAVRALLDQTEVERAEGEVRFPQIRPGLDGDTYLGANDGNKEELPCTVSRQGYLKMITMTNMTPLFNTVLSGSKFDWAAPMLDQLITRTSAYQKEAHSGKFIVIHVLMVLLKIWRKEDTEEIGLDIRPKLTEYQVERILAQLPGEPNSKNLPEMAPLGSLEILEQIENPRDRRTPDIDDNSRPEPIEAVPTAEGGKKRGKDQIEAYMLSLFGSPDFHNPYCSRICASTL
ncbi:hypothetical protein R1sor_009347 [Riccia sorocarpa]|uniref:Uncharacterized protein n=1 Tax=Riccia sorocarpa TaxID=122646 RepID=A0ABD3HWR5_9MARC